MTGANRVGENPSRPMREETEVARDLFKHDPAYSPTDTLDENRAFLYFHSRLATPAGGKRARERGAPETEAQRRGQAGVK